MKVRNSLMTAMVAVIAVSALAGCRADEQGRVTSFEKGVYLGKTEASLSEATLRTLRARAGNQAGPVGLSFASRGRVGATDLDNDALRKRARGQNNNY